ncbi:MAG: T9SS type A sorting domain-containing protein [Chitinophagales bacterium]|nr:T9SS type A sorting domain-containing protein [Chitinophagales bacterium]
MKKFYLLVLTLSQCIISYAQLPELIFGNPANVSILNFSPVISVVQYGSGSTSQNFDLNTDGSGDISINIERKLSALYESAYITFPNAAAELALSNADNLTVVAFKPGDSLFADQYSYDFDESAFDGAVLYVKSGSNSYGQFSIPAFRYLAFRIAATDTLYGWLRLSRTADFNTDSLAYRVDQLAYQGELTDILPIPTLNDLQVYPTVTDDAVMVEGSDFSKSEASLYTLSGKLIYRAALKPSDNILHLAAYPNGMYLLVISTEAGRQAVKLVKQ